LSPVILDDVISFVTTRPLQNRCVSY